MYRLDFFNQHEIGSPVHLNQDDWWHLWNHLGGWPPAREVHRKGVPISVMWYMIHKSPNTPGGNARASKYCLLQMENTLQDCQWTNQTTSQGFVQNFCAVLMTTSRFLPLPVTTFNADIFSQLQSTLYPRQGREHLGPLPLCRRLVHRNHFLLRLEYHCFVFLVYNLGNQCLCRLNQWSQ